MTKVGVMEWKLDNGILQSGTKTLMVMIVIVVLRKVRKWK